MMSWKRSRAALQRPRRHSAEAHGPAQPWPCFPSERQRELRDAHDVASPCPFRALTSHGTTRRGGGSGHDPGCPAARIQIPALQLGKGAFTARSPNEIRSGFAAGQSYPYAAPALIAGVATGGTSLGIAASSLFGATLETAENALMTRNELYMNGVNANGVKMTSQDADRLAAENFSKELLPNIIFQTLELGTLMRASKYAKPSMGLGGLARGTGDVLKSGVYEAAQEGVQGLIQYNIAQKAEGGKELDMYDYMQTEDFAHNFFGGFAGGISMGAPVKPMVYLRSVSNWKGMIKDSKVAFASAATNEFADGVPYANAMHAEMNGTGKEFRDGIRLRIDNEQYENNAEKENLNKTLSYSTRLVDAVQREGVVASNVNGLYAAHNSAMADMYDSLAKADEGASNLSKVYAEKARAHKTEAANALNGDAKVYYATDVIGRPLFMSEKTAKVLGQGTLEQWKQKGYISSVNAINDDTFISDVATRVNAIPVRPAQTTQAVEQPQETPEQVLERNKEKIPKIYQDAFASVTATEALKSIADQALARTETGEAFAIPTDKEGQLTAQAVRDGSIATAKEVFGEELVNKAIEMFPAVDAVPEQAAAKIPAVGAKFTSSSEGVGEVTVEAVVGDKINLLFDDGSREQLDAQEFNAEFSDKARGMAAPAKSGVIVDESGEPTVFYRGTDVEGVVSKEASGALFFTPDKEFASSFSGTGEKARVDEAHISVKNTFDYNNPEHIQRVAKLLDPPLVEGLSSGRWNMLEYLLDDYDEASGRSILEEAGFDSMYVVENKYKHVFSGGKWRAIPLKETVTNIAVLKPSEQVDYTKGSKARGAAASQDSSTQLFIEVAPVETPEAKAYRVEMKKALEEFSVRSTNKKFPKALEIAKKILPPDIYKRFEVLYRVAEANRVIINVGAGSVLPGAIASFQYGSVNIDPEVMARYTSSWEEFAEVFNHEVIHGVLFSMSGNTKFKMHQQLAELHKKLMENYSTASPEVQHILDYITEASEQGSVIDFDNLPDDVDETPPLTPDMEEMITYAFTNTEFVKFLDSISIDEATEARPKSLWSKLKDIIREAVQSLVKGKTALDKIGEIVDESFKNQATQKARYETIMKKDGWTTGRGVAAPDAKPVRGEKEDKSVYIRRVLEWRKQMLASAEPANVTAALSQSQGEVDFVKRLNEGIELLRKDVNMTKEDFNRTMSIPQKNDELYVASLKYLKSSNKDAAKKLAEIRKENPKMVVATEISLLKKQLKDVERGFKEGSKDAKNKIKAIRDEVMNILNDYNKQELFNGVEYTPKELLRMASYVNNAINETSLNNFRSMVSKLIDKADFGRQVTAAKDLQKKVRKILKSKDIITANDIAVLKDLLTLNPLRLSEHGLGKYISALTEVANTRVGKDVRMLSNETLQNFVEEERAFDVRERAIEAIEKYFTLMDSPAVKELNAAGKVTRMPSDVEFQQFVDAIANPAAAKGYKEQVRELNRINETLNYLNNSAQEKVEQAVAGAIPISDGTPLDDADAVAAVQANSDTNDRTNKNRLVLEEMARAQQESIDLDDATLNDEQKAILKTLKSPTYPGSIAIHSDCLLTC